MKKVNLILLFSVISISCFSQEFLGIKVDGTKQEVINQFVAKGFKVNPKLSTDNVTRLDGSYGGTTFEVNVVYTPLTKKVWKFAVYLPEQTSWYSLKSSYDKYLSTLTAKYGEPTKSYGFFSSPYYEGDGYEMTALAVEKCTYASYWLDIIICIEISKYKQIKISYENAVNSELDDQEREKINKNVF